MFLLFKLLGKPSCKGSIVFVQMSRLSPAEYQVYCSRLSTHGCRVAAQVMHVSSPVSQLRSDLLVILYTDGTGAASLLMRPFESPNLNSISQLKDHTGWEILCSCWVFFFNPSLKFARFTAVPKFPHVFLDSFWESTPDCHCK